MIMFILINVVWCVLLFCIWSWRKKSRYVAPPTFPGALPLIGHLHHFRTNRAGLWNLATDVIDFSINNGGVTEMRLGIYSLYVITDPDDSMTVANTCLDKPYVYDFVKPIFGTGLGTAKASTWKVHRKWLNPSFHQQIFYTFVDEYNELARNLVSLLASDLDKDKLDVRQCFIDYSLLIASRTALALRPEDEKLVDKEFALTIHRCIKLGVRRGLSPLLHLDYFFNRSSLKKRQDKLGEFTTSIMNSVIQKRKSEMQANQNTKQAKFKPLLDQMLDLTDNHNVFSEDDIISHLNTVVFATYDTISTAFTYALVLIGSYPEVQERIYKELIEVLGDSDRDLTKEDFQKLVYLEAVVKETLRLYPPAAIVSRDINTDVKLKNYTLPAGNIAIICLYGINRHTMWGPDADQFRPERWLDSATLPDNPNAFATFSLGKRNCIGKVTAMMIMKITLAHVFRRFHVTGDINKVVTVFDVVIRAVSGHHISLKLRK